MTMPKAKYFQKTTDKPPLDRTDHIWLERRDEHGTIVNWKCCLCGCVVTDTPPFYPTPKAFIPRVIEELTPEERGLVPPDVGVIL